MDSRSEEALTLTIVREGENGELEAVDAFYERFGCI